MAVEKKFSIAIVDIEKIEEVNKILLKHATDVEEYSSYYYFDLRPMREEDINHDITYFRLVSENESDFDKELNVLIEELDRLNTLYAIRDEATHEMIAEIEHITSLVIKFDNVKFIKKGTYEKIDSFNHLKTEFGICKCYNPNFRPVEGMSIENTTVKPETVYLFSDSEENLTKLMEFVSKRIRKIDSNLEMENVPFMFID